MGISAYDPRTFRALTFHDALDDFRNGTDTPRDYLERCLATIDAHEATVKAFVTVNHEGARQAADVSTTRWKAGAPLSPIDGLPIGIKDLLETKDMPTQMGCLAYEGNFPRRDNAAVWALREAGAVIVGKTVTAELGGAHPGPTTNPFNAAHTPGGSSSGSAAAVAARMLPAAIGTQVGGSIIRPAAYCGNFALKPTQGGINRGERQATSMSTHGAHAGCLEDVWQVSIEIAKRAGGDRGALGLFGPDYPPSARMPERLAVLQTEGWTEVDDASKNQFEALLETLAARGVTILRREDNPLLDSLERAIDGARDTCNAITSWENRWAQRNLVDQNPHGVSERAQRTLARAEAMTPDDYRAALLRRDEAQLRHRNLAGIADAAISLSCPGPAPLWPGDVPGQPLLARPTGDPVFNFPSSLLFAPAVTMPLISVNALPVGVQLIGQMHEDATMVGFARWVAANVPPSVTTENG